MNKYLILAETKFDVKIILNYLSTMSLKDNNLIWVALEYESDLEMKLNGIEPLSIIDYISTKEREEIFKSSVYWAKNWLNETKLSDNLLLTKRASMPHIFESSIYYLFDDLFYLVIILENLLKKVKPTLLILPYYYPNEVTRLDHIGERYLFDVGKIISKKYNIKLLPLRIESSKHCTDNLINNINEKYYVPSDITFLNKFLISNKNKPKKNYPNHLKVKLKNKKILVLGGGKKSPFWRLTPLIKVLKNEFNCRIKTLLDKEEKAEENESFTYLSKNRDKIRESQDYQHLKKELVLLNNSDIGLKKILFHGANLNFVFEKKIKWILNYFLPSYYLDYLVLDQEMKERKFDLLISADQNPLNIASVHIFKNYNISTLLIPHGIQFIKYKKSNKLLNYFNFLSPTYFSNIFVAGEYSRRNFLSNSKVYKNKISVTGGLDSLAIKKYPKLLNLLFSFKRKTKKKKTVTYFLGRASRSFHSNYVNISFAEIIESIHDIVNVCNRLELDLFIKPHPSFYNFSIWIKTYFPNQKLKIINSKNSNSYLIMSSDLIIGSKSTILIEGIRNKIPTIIFEHRKREIHFYENLSCPIDDYNKYNRKPFFRATGYKELLYTCETILSKNFNRNKFNEKQVTLINYFNYSDDDNQINRILSSIIKILY